MTIVDNAFYVSE